MIEIKGFVPVSLIDYPSQICSVIFLAGCNFNCPWCHNRELIEEEKYSKMKTISQDEIISFLDKRKGKIDAICISGGEPTVHGDELLDVIKEFKQKGVLVKLDTNGSNPEILERLIIKNLLDFVAIDIKNTEQKYNKTIGLKNFDFSKILKTLNIMKESKIKFQTRTTIVPDLVEKSEIIEFAKKLDINIIFQNYK